MYIIIQRGIGAKSFVYTQSVLYLRAVVVIRASGLLYIHGRDGASREVCLTNEPRDANDLLRRGG